MGFFYLEKCKRCKRLYIIRRKSHQYVAQIVAICLGTRYPPREQRLLVSCSPVPHHVVPEGPLEGHGSLQNTLHHPSPPFTTLHHPSPPFTYRINKSQEKSHHSLIGNDGISDYFSNIYFTITFFPSIR